MDEIREWLNSSQRNYQAGIQLYLRFGSDRLLKKMFTTEAVSDYKKKRLLQELQTIHNNQKNPTTPEAAIQRIIIKQDPAENYKHWPPFPIQDPVVLALHEQWKPLYSEMLNLQARIHDVALLGAQDNLKRLEACSMAHRILDLDDACDEIYGKRDYYYLNKQLPQKQVEEEVVGDPIRWVTNLSSAQRYVRQYKASLKKDPSNENHAAKLLYWEAEVVKYKKLLKLD